MPMLGVQCIVGKQQELRKWIQIQWSSGYGSKVRTGQICGTCHSFFFVDSQKRLGKETWSKALGIRIIGH